MRKKLIAMLLGGVLTASMLGGCGKAPATEGSNIQGSDTGESDSWLSELQGEGGESEGTEVSQADEEESTDSEDAAAKNTEDETTAASPLAGGSATFSVVDKRYTEFYKGDVVFDENEEYSKDYSNGILFEGNYSYVILDDDYEAEYPALYKALKDYADDGLNKADDWVKSYVETAKDEYENAAKEKISFYGPYKENNTVYITRFDDKITSIYEYGYSFEGGAHGYYGASGLNYDTQTGKQLYIGDVIKVSKEEFDAALKTELLKIAEYDDEYGSLDEKLAQYTLFEGNYDDMNNISYEYKWYCSYDGLHVVFNIYELASYADGMQDIVLGYDSGIMKDEYVPAQTDNFCVRERLYLVNSKYDESEEMHLRYIPTYDDENYDGYLYADDLELVLNGKSAGCGCGFYLNDDDELECYRVRANGGKEYIYVIIPFDNDYCQLEVFDITGGDVKFVGDQGYHYIYAYYEGGGNVLPTFTNTDNMHFGHVVDAMGSFEAYGIYEVGPDGLPKPTSDDYYVAWQCSENIVSKVDIEADIINEDGSIVESGVTIPAGTHIDPFRTDRKTRLDCRLDDGRIVRFTYTTFDYPASLKEGEVTDLFDGLQYAG